MRTTTMLGRIGAGVLAGALLLTTPIAAGATDSMTGMKRLGDAAIQRRLAVLSRLEQVVGAARHLSAGDRSALGGQLEQETSGLTALDAKIQGDTDPVVTRADVASIVTAYRVYVLMAPKVRLARAGDAALAACDGFDRIAADLQRLIAAAAAAGRNTSAATAKLDDLKAMVAAARSAAGSIASSVVPLTPAGYPGNRSVLDSARASLRTVHAGLLAARADAVAIIAMAH
jgi:hypothetical protein